MPRQTVTLLLSLVHNARARTKGSGFMIDLPNPISKDMAERMIAKRNADIRIFGSTEKAHMHRRNIQRVAANNSCGCFRFTGILCTYCQFKVEDLDNADD